MSKQRHTIHNASLDKSTHATLNQGRKDRLISRPNWVTKPSAGQYTVINGSERHSQGASATSGTAVPAPGDRSNLAIGCATHGVVFDRNVDRTR